MLNLLFLILAGPYILWPLNGVPLTKSEGADRLIVAQTSRRQVRWGEIRRAYAAYSSWNDRERLPGEKLDLINFVRAYLQVAEREAGPGPDPTSPNNGGASPSQSGPIDQFHRQSNRAARLTRSIIEGEDGRRVPGGPASPPDSVAWTVYPLVDMISAWKFRNLVLTGRVPEAILDRGGRLGGAGTIAAQRVELHPSGAHRDDRLVAGMMPGQLSGPIRENGHYKIIRLTRRLPGADIESIESVNRSDDVRELEPAGPVRFALIGKLSEKEGWQ